MIITPRLRLRRWVAGDRDAFAQMNSDPEVMHDLGGPISRYENDRKFDQYANCFEAFECSRWLIETKDNQEPDGFIGYAGVMARPEHDHPLGAHHEIGWRLTRRAWGFGYASAASQAALADVFARLRPSEVLSYTSANNQRSQAVMKRLGLARDKSRDFTTDYPDVGQWNGLVWSTSAPRK